MRLKCWGTSSTSCYSGRCNVVHNSINSINSSSTLRMYSSNIHSRLHSISQQLIRGQIMMPPQLDKPQPSAPAAVCDRVNPPCCCCRCCCC